MSRVGLARDKKRGGGKRGAADAGGGARHALSSLNTALKVAELDQTHAWVAARSRELEATMLSTGPLAVTAGDMPGRLRLAGEMMTPVGWDAGRVVLQPRCGL